MDQASNLRSIVKKQNTIDRTKRARVITVTSGKGGVGKTNVAVNLAINFSRNGKKVVIIDADFGLANIEVIFGTVPKHNLYDLLFNGMSMFEVLTTGPMGVEFISGGSGIQELTNVSSEQVAFCLEKLYELDYYADIIIIDTGAGISNNILDFIYASDEVILVATPEPTSITDAYALLKALKHKNYFNKQSSKKINLIVNRTASSDEGLEIYNKLNRVANKFLDIELQNIGYLPQDQYLTKAVIEQKPVAILYPNSRVSKGFQEVAQNILQFKEVENVKTSGITEVFSRLINIRTKTKWGCKC